MWPGIGANQLDPMNVDKLYSLAKLINSNSDLSQLESSLFITVQCPWDELVQSLIGFSHNGSVVYTNQCVGVRRGTVTALHWYPSEKLIKFALITGPSLSAVSTLEYCQEDQLLWLGNINAFLSLLEAIIWWQRSSTLVLFSVNEHRGTNSDHNHMYMLLRDGRR